VSTRTNGLAARIEALASTPPGEQLPPEAAAAVDELLDALEQGGGRAAERDARGRWSAVPWVKRGILLGFRVGTVADM
jgi:2,3,4,5-tetrahydropyridine-2-carboxylate N-succinyltransferase